MGSGMSTTALMGDKWDRRLGFIQYQPCSDAITIRRVTIEEMPAFANSFQDVFIKKIWSYWSSIDRDPKKKFDPAQLHRFLVIETSHGFFSIEQGKRGIVVQYSCTKDDVVNKFCGEMRILPWFSREKKNLYLDFKEILKWIYSNNELKKGYSFMSNNCHHFMKRLVYKTKWIASGLWK